MLEKLPVIIKLQSNGSYYAECPDIDGCFTQGDTYEDALDALRELVADIIADNTPLEIRNTAGEWIISKISV